MTTQHTPGRLVVHTYPDSWPSIHDETGKTVTDAVDTEAEAHEIARRYNAFPALLEALRLLYSWVDNWDCPFKDDDEWPEDDAKIRAAIAQAQPEES